MHLYRDPNGRYYFRYALPRFLIEQLAAHRHREVRLSLFTYHRWQAAELAQAYWLACREILKNPEKFKFSTIEELKTHIRNAAMAHSPDQYTSLIELTGSVDNGKLVAAIKVLLAYRTDFFVVAPKGMEGTIAKKVNGDWDQIARIRGQTFPHMRVPVFLIQDAITSDLDVIHPKWSSKGYAI